jgi:bile acid-coenzyme A ligase
MSEMPLGTLLSELAEQQPHAPSVTFEGVTTSRVELDRAANRLARAYAELGVTQGDMVTVGLPNGSEFLAACAATWKLGAIPQPVSSRLPQAERDAIVELADSRLVVGAAPGSHGDRACVPEGFQPDADLDDSPLPPVVSPSWKAPTSGGSTGRPKLIVAGQPGVMQPAIAVFFGIEAGHTQLVAGPMYHNAPFMFAMVGLFVGQHLVILRRFDAVAALQAIDEHGVDIAMVVPTMLNRMLRVLQEGEAESGQRPYRLDSLRRIWHMAAPCPEWLKRAWIDILGPEKVWKLYGGTEAQATTIIDGNDWLAHPGSVGRVTPGTMAILGGDGSQLPPGEVGEIFMRVRSEAPSYRYIGAEARRRVGTDGSDGEWESIGDLGSIDEDGFLYLADRRTDLILSGGANIYPAEVENALLEHLAVESCAVVGLPDNDLGKVAHAVVHLVEGTTDVTVDDLRRFLEGRLVRYKVPRTWELVDEPVRDDAGKVRRTALADDRSASSG